MAEREPFLRIDRLSPSDAPALARVMRAEGRSRLRYFTPFPFDAASMRRRLTGAKRDRYWGLWTGSRLAGFFMLRGLDEGYRMPSYGVFVSRRRTGLGLSRLALQYALCWCSLAGVSTVMLKCHPRNARAWKVYRDFGFKKHATEPASGQVVMRKTLAVA